MADVSRLATIGGYGFYPESLLAALRAAEPGGAPTQGAYVADSLELTGALSMFLRGSRRGRPRGPASRKLQVRDVEFGPQLT